MLKLTTLAWVDAFTMQLEAVAEAKNNPEMRREVRTAVALAERAARKQDTAEAQKIAANQRMIAHQMRFNAEDHQELMRLWRAASTQVCAMDWDLAEEIHFQEVQAKGDLRFWQGDSPLRNTCTLPRAQAALLIKFLRFMQQQSESVGYDPKLHVQRMLTEQGITKENFHLHADKLAITNPWL